MTLTAAEIARATGGTVIGNPDTVVSHPAKLEEAIAGSLCFFPILSTKQFCILRRQM